MRAGLRLHGTTQARPAEVFAEEELARLLGRRPRPMTCRCNRGQRSIATTTFEVARALYSVPGNLIGSRVDARADRCLVRLFHRGQLVKVHPRMPPGQRSTDPADLPSAKTAYAMRGLALLQRMAAAHGEAVGAPTRRRCSTPRCRGRRCARIYALVGLVKNWGAERVEAAYRSSLDHEVVNVGLIERMLERGTEGIPLQRTLPGTVVPGGSPATPATSP